jgi:hypothetical protein
MIKVKDGSEAEKTKDIAVVPTELDEQEPEIKKKAVEPKSEVRQPTTSSQSSTPAASAPARESQKAKQNPAPRPEAKPKPKPKPVAAPAAEPAAEPAAAAPAAAPPPYRIRLEIKGEERRVTCGDGQRPEVTGIVNLTFDSIQFCRVEIDGGMGILNVAASGTYSCVKSGQVRCSKTR